jgi:hypothetical protein
MKDRLIELLILILFMGCVCVCGLLTYLMSGLWGLREVPEEEPECPSQIQAAQAEPDEWVKCSGWMTHGNGEMCVYRPESVKNYPVCDVAEVEGQIGKERTVPGEDIRCLHNSPPQCLGNVIERCGPDKRWYEHEDCGAQNKVCAYGNPVCTKPTLPVKQNQDFP